jgi:hypothetical protein
MNRRVPNWVMIFAATLVSFGRSEDAAPPQRMEAVRVGGAVPLVKVADYHLKLARYGSAAVAEGDYIYVVGGGDEAGRCLDSVERFNIRTNKSEIFAHLKTARRWVRAVLHERKIYVLGGQAQTVSGYRDEDTTEIIEIATGKISAGPKLPFGMAHLGCALLGDELYLIGGRESDEHQARITNRVQILNLVTGKWSEGPTMPTPRQTLVTVAAGMIVAAGGYNGTAKVANVEVLDPRSGQWHILPPLCEPISGNSVAMLGHHLFLLGDFDDLGQIVAYDLRAKTSEAFNLRFLRTRHTAALAHEGRIYVLGGKLETMTTFDYVQVFEQPKREP